MKRVMKKNPWIPDVCSGIFLLSILIASCRETVDTSLEDRLAQIETGALFTLDTLQQGDWDSVCIIRPYEDAEKVLKGKVIGREEAKTVSNNVLFDDFCTLLLMKENSITQLYTIGRQSADFAALLDTIYTFGRKTVFRINADRKVSVYIL